MLHLGYNRSGDTFPATVVSQSSIHRQPDLLPPCNPWAIQTNYSPPTPPINNERQTNTRNVVVHWTQAGHSYTSGGRSDDDETSRDTESRPFTPPPPRERLSYTRYQLELLNGVYKQVKYPNSTQKLLIAKRVGITRDQVKIWFQNRRRKDVLAKQGRKHDGDDNTLEGSPVSVLGEGNEENRGEGMVPSVVMDSILSELVKYKNEHLKSKKQKSKKKQTEPTKTKTSVENLADGNVRVSGQWGLFSGYDMVSPPNQITPSAFEKLSNMNRTSNYVKRSAFERPKEQRIQSQRSPPLSYLNYDCNQSVSRYNTSHSVLESFNGNYNPLSEVNNQHQGRMGNGFPLDRPNSCQENGAGKGTSREIVPNQSQHGSGSIHPDIDHSDTIPVLSDLLEHSQRQATSTSKSRDSLWWPTNIRSTEDEPGSSAYPNYLPFDPANTNRVPITFPFISESAGSGSGIRLADPYRPQPQYPSSFCQHDPYQAFQGSSSNNPYYTHHQSSVTPGHSWHESSYQDHSFVNL